MHIIDFELLCDS